MGLISLLQGGSSRSRGIVHAPKHGRSLIKRSDFTWTGTGRPTRRKYEKRSSAIFKINPHRW